jgi:hypothetical protein
MVGPSRNASPGLGLLDNPDVHDAFGGGGGDLRCCLHAVFDAVFDAELGERVVHVAVAVQLRMQHSSPVQRYVEVGRAGWRSSASQQWMDSGNGRRPCGAGGMQCGSRTRFAVHLRRSLDDGRRQTRRELLGRDLVDQIGREAGVIQPPVLVVRNAVAALGRRSVILGRRVAGLAARALRSRRSRISSGDRPA